MSTIKPKILAICDHIAIPSGVGHMANLILTHLVKKGFDVCQMAGAVKHPGYNIQNVMGVKIYPVNVYGSPDDLRSVMKAENPDLIFLFTDPRYFEWVWSMEDEIRNKMPIFYYHVWDCDPIPEYNRMWYESCDHISCISKLTYDISSKFNKNVTYVPHGINTDIFKPIDDQHLLNTVKGKVINKQFNFDDDTFIVFWNNRNIRRKIPAELMKAFAIFNKEIKNSILILHTNVVDNEGTDLYAVRRDLCKDAKIVFDDNKVDQNTLNLLYNLSDVTVNISFNEGFGLSTLESMAAGTPIIVNLTGGLQDQISFFSDEGLATTGIGLEPDARTIVGSPPTPYIHDDRVSTEKIVDALIMMNSLGKKRRKEIGLWARKNVEMNFTEKQMVEGIERDIRSCLKNFKPRQRYDLREVVG